MSQACVTELIPSEDKIFAWIEEVFGHGIRRPGYPADRWAEEWLQEQFRAFGLERVRAEPVEVPYWEPREATLNVDGRRLHARYSRASRCRIPRRSKVSKLNSSRFDPARPEAVRGRLLAIRRRS